MSCDTVVPRRHRTPLFVAGQRMLLSALLLCGARQAVGADRIRLKNGAELSGTILAKDGDRVILQVARPDVVAVNGQALPAAVTAGAPAPAFDAVDVTGVKHTVPNAQGQPMLLTFWASWCPHCRADLPLVKDVFARYGQDKGLRIVAVSVDQDLNALRAFLHERDVRYPVIAMHDPAASPQQAALADLYEAQGIPTYFLIDAKGTIVHTLSGSIVEGKQDLEGLLKPLLPAAGSSSPRS